MEENTELEEGLILAWVRLTGAVKNTRITHGMIYNEAIVMMIAYEQLKKDGEGIVSFKDIVSETKMLKSLVNRTIDSLVQKGYLQRCAGKDKRMTFVKPVQNNLGDFLAVHRESMQLAKRIISVIGEEETRTLIRISEKIRRCNPLIE